MPSVSRAFSALGISGAAALLATACPVSSFAPETDPWLVDLVPHMGTTGHGEVRALGLPPCVVDGPAIDRGSAYREVSLGAAQLDWSLPNRSFDATLPILIATRIQAWAIPTTATRAFVELTLFSVEDGPYEGDLPCTVTCQGEVIHDAYLVPIGLVTDEEIDAVGLSLDEAKAILTDHAEARDAAEEEGGGTEAPAGCDSILGP